MPKFKTEYVSFEEAKAFAKSLKLRTTTEWELYVRGYLKELPPKPANIPNAPNNIYLKCQGWKGLKDFLGCEEHKLIKKEFPKPLIEKLPYVAPKRDWLNYFKAREFVHAFKFQSSVDWQAYCKEGRLNPETGQIEKRPFNIPCNPKITYEFYWRGWGDWLGPSYLNKSDRSAYYSRMKGTHKTFDTIKVIEPKIPKRITEPPNLTEQQRVKNITEFLKPKQ